MARQNMKFDWTLVARTLLFAAILGIRPAELAAQTYPSTGPISGYMDFHFNKVEGEVLIVGDCAKGMLEKFPDARYWGDCKEYPNCTPIWANRPDVGIANYVRQLTAVREGNAR